MTDFITVLTEDHRRVEQLFKQFDLSADPAVAMQICVELTVHATIEEELLYGLYSAKVDSAGAVEARAEHEEARQLIQAVETMDPASDELVTTMTKLKTVVLHHVDEEENEIFPKLLDHLPGTAALLGQELVARRGEVEAEVRADRALGLAPVSPGQRPAAGR